MLQTHYHERGVEEEDPRSAATIGQASQRPDYHQTWSWRSPNLEGTLLARQSRRLDSVHLRLWARSEKPTKYRSQGDDQEKHKWLEGRYEGCSPKEPGWHHYHNWPSASCHEWCIPNQLDVKVGDIRDIPLVKGGRHTCQATGPADERSHYKLETSWTPISGWGRTKLNGQ